MEWIGSLIGAAGGIGSGLFSGWLNKYNAESAAKYNYTLQRRSLEQFPKSQRKGLLSAGYNPMLALNGGVPSYTGGVAAGSTGGFDILSSAAQGAKLSNDIVKGIKLANDQKRLENENLESDLKTKEQQRLQMEANESLLRSQTDRTDLAYGRDIVGTIADVAGTAGSLYSAKAMRDIARSPQETITTIHHGDKTKPTEIIKSSGRPSVDSSAKGSKPNVGALGSSAKSVGRVAKDLALQIALPALLAKPVVELRRKADSVERNHPRGNRKKGYNFVPRLGL